MPSFAGFDRSRREVLLVAAGLVAALPVRGRCESAAAGSSPPPTPAPSFRVETDLFEGTQNKPQSQHLLLFDSGVIYDLPVDSEPTLTIFDPSRGRVVLLHKTQRLRTSIPTESLIQISAKARSAAIEAGSAKTLGLEARAVAGQSSSSYSIEFGDTKYTALTQTALSEPIAGEYAAFTVWACRLNIARRIGSPPFARMTLADLLAAEKVVPKTVKLEVRRGLKTRSYRSEHRYVGRLSESDRKKIASVGEMITAFEEVEFAAFPHD